MACSTSLYLLFRKLRAITELHGEDFFKVWRHCILCMWFVTFMQLSVEIMRIAGHFALWKGGGHQLDVLQDQIRCPHGCIERLYHRWRMRRVLRATSARGQRRSWRLMFSPHMVNEVISSRSFMWVLVCLRYRNGVSYHRKLDTWATAGADRNQEQPIEEIRTEN